MNISKVNESTEESKKIILMGLDNSGKTSIVSCLKGNKGISAFNNPKPTKGLDVQNFKVSDSKYAVWDFGGQKAYIEDYFKDFSNYSKGVSKIIYVIDIQDVKRYDLALEYLKKLINSIDTTNKIDFSIFLHKFDPDLVFNRSLSEIVINDFIKKIKEIIPLDIAYSINKTTIYAIFEKSKIK